MPPPRHLLWSLPPDLPGARHAADSLAAIRSAKPSRARQSGSPQWFPDLPQLGAVSRSRPPPSARSRWPTWSKLPATTARSFARRWPTSAPRKGPHRASRLVPEPERRLGRGRQHRHRQHGRLSRTRSSNKRSRQPAGCNWPACVGGWSMWPTPKWRCCGGRTSIWLPCRFGPTILPCWSPRKTFA